MIEVDAHGDQVRAAELPLDLPPFTGLPSSDGLSGVDTDPETGAVLLTITTVSVGLLGDLPNAVRVCATGDQCNDASRCLDDNVLAPTPCVFAAYGCPAKTRGGADRCAHHNACPFWTVTCRVCGLVLPRREFGVHLESKHDVVSRAGAEVCLHSGTVACGRFGRHTADVCPLLEVICYGCEAVFPSRAAVERHICPLPRARILAYPPDGTQRPTLTHVAPAASPMWDDIEATLARAQAWRDEEW